MKTVAKTAAFLMVVLAPMGFTDVRYDRDEPITRITVQVTDVRVLYEEATVSWYGEPFHGRTTASGKVYDMHGISAAHRELKFGTPVLFLNPENGEQLVVPVTDRGPYPEWKGKRYFHGDRDFDLSFGAAQELGIVEQGVADLKFVVLK